jgi:hypothetical protein
MRFPFLLLALAGCVTAGPVVVEQPVFLLYRGPPSADGTHRRYWDACGNWGGGAPLENYLQANGWSNVAWLDTAPSRRYRVLFEGFRNGADEAQLMDQALKLAASFGADAVMRRREAVATTGGPITTVEETRENRWRRITRVETTDNTSSTITLTTDAIHYAESGTEPYTGIQCSTYSPYSQNERAHLGDPLRMAAVTGALGPSAAGGVRGGDFALEWWVNEHWGTGDCWSLYQSIRAGGPRANVRVSLWQPTTEARPLSLNVKLARRLGVEFAVKEGQVAVKAPRPGGPGAMAGFLPGDVLLAVDGREVHSLVESVTAISGGGLVQRYEVARGGAKLQLTATTEGFVGNLGLRNMPGVGVLVTFVPDASLSTGLAPGDIITNVADWHAIDGQGADAWPGSTTATLQVVRQGVSRMATFTTVPMSDDWYR